MDLQNLSKIKHIYRIYESWNGVLHCEKFPVVYLNSKVVYFKDGRKQDFLCREYIQNVNDDFTDFCKNNHYRSNFNEYFWNVEPNFQEVLEDLKRQRKEMLDKKEEQKKRDRLEKAKKEYETALKEVELLDSLKATLD